MAIDPVCGMNVQEGTPFVTNYDGSKYYLCSEGCKTSFEKNPQKYLKK
jgi:YHS domain-containing protein